MSEWDAFDQRKAAQAILPHLRTRHIQELVLLKNQGLIRTGQIRPRGALGDLLSWGLGLHGHSEEMGWCVIPTARFQVLLAIGEEMAA